MRAVRALVVVFLALVALVANGAVVNATRGFAGGAKDSVLMPPGAQAFRATVAAAAQEPSALEASLDLDRPTRRLIQQGLRNEGFDPGAPDGLFGPRTRGAIRRWQEARGEPATGYLHGVA